MAEANLSSFIWSVADLLRGDYKQSEYGKVILPFTVLRRLDCVLASSKEAVLAEFALRKKANVNPEPFLLKKSGLSFYNTSPLDFKKLMGDTEPICCTSWPRSSLTSICTPTKSPMLRWARCSRS
jgi:type I restriction enzyme M protein